jgi:hypothetical protein
MIARSRSGKRATLGIASSMSLTSRSVKGLRPSDGIGGSLTSRSTERWSPPRASYQRRCSASQLARDLRAMTALRSRQRPACLSFGRKF